MIKTSFVPSQTIGNYEILSIIDKPKAGVTYKVRNLTTHGLELLRALPGSSANDPEGVERFLREIRVHTRLSHPNVVAFHDAMPFDGQLIMTAEYVEGPTLAETLSHGPLPWRESVRYIGDLLSALEEAHALGIVHRSINPDSIIITAEGAPKLGGFGLAKPMADMKLTQAGSVLGDPRYISPEQVSGLTAIDGRADLYSIGVVLYQALTGRTPFDGRNDFEIMVAHVKEQPPAPSTSGGNIPSELDGIVLKAMAKDPANRFQSAREFREALEVAAASLPQAAEGGIRKTAPALLPAGFDTQPAWHSRKSILVGVASAVVGLVIIIVLAMHKS